MNHSAETADTYADRELSNVIEEIKDVKKLSDNDIDQICQVLKTLNK